MAAPAGRLREWLLGLGSNNSQREYYLTDVVAGAVKSGDAVVAVPVATAIEVLGVNDRIQLAQVEAAHRRLRTEELMLAGATLADPFARGYSRQGDRRERRVHRRQRGAHWVGCTWDRACSIGPNCVIRDSHIAADTEIFANCVIEDSGSGGAIVE